MWQADVTGMTESRPQKDPPPKLLAGRATKIWIALASAVALTFGAWLMPRTVPTNLAAPQEHAAPLLEEQAQRRETNRPFIGVQDVAARVNEHSVAILRPTSPPLPDRNDYSEADNGVMRVTGFGVFVSDTHVLTHTLALARGSSVELSIGDAVSRRASVVAYEPASGLVLLQTEPSGRAAPGTAAEAPTPGALAVAVGRSHEREWAIPVFVTGVGGGTFTIGSVTETVPPGMPVFNLAGELFAIAAPDAGEVRAVPAREAAERLIARASAGERRSSFGLGFQALSGALTDVFGDDGVVITEVLPGAPADDAGVRVGDILLAAGDAQVDSAETAARVLSTAGIGTPTGLRIRRAARVIELQVTPASAYEVAALARASSDSASGPEARTVFPAALLEASGIPPSARVLAVNGRALMTRAEVQRELRRARKPVPVLLKQGSHQFFVALDAST
jgi:S1-C subfamily serine protease